MEKNGLIYFLLLWIVSICSVACSCDMQIPHGDVTWWCARQDPPCSYSCHEGYKEHDTVFWLKCSTSGQWVSWNSSLQVSAKDLCTPKPCPTVISKGAFSPACEAVVGSTCRFSCEAGYIRNTSVSELTCQTSTEWSPDLRSLCLRTFNVSKSTGERNGDGNVGTIVAITVPALAAILIITMIIFFVVWIAKSIRSSERKSPRRVPGNVGGTCLRPRENRDQNVTTLQQQPDADGIDSVSSFESPSYNGLYVHSFVQRNPTISSSCNYPDPPPSYLEAQTATNESPPTYDEAVTDPYILNLYI